MRLFAWAARSPLRFRLAGGLLRLYLRLALWRNPHARLRGPLRAWTARRDFPRPERETFRAAWRRLSK